MSIAPSQPDYRRLNLPLGAGRDGPVASDLQNTCAGRLVAGISGSLSLLSDAARIPARLRAFVDLIRRKQAR